ncbi:hypothetical protein PanWU01x14_221900 [Parasponia andersonii]|uniref:Uncharacterized protein n=1 Tax=Parasponia andersonii TaxID=3476 RepID=A0A2P5BPC4_PARAD|nr:hypothetical protein PanWU01x14_221900 [Parasponia andersonii]
MACIKNGKASETSKSPNPKTLLCFYWTEYCDFIFVIIHCSILGSGTEFGFLACFIELSSKHSSV